jgi:hypothetical protein
MLRALAAGPRAEPVRAVGSRRAPVATLSGNERDTRAAAYAERRREVSAAPT